MRDGRTAHFCFAQLSQNIPHHVMSSMLSPAPQRQEGASPCAARKTWEDKQGPRSCDCCDVFTFRGHVRHQPENSCVVHGGMCSWDSWRRRRQSCMHVLHASSSLCLTHTHSNYSNAGNLTVGKIGCGVGCRVGCGMVGCGMVGYSGCRTGWVGLGRLGQDAREGWGWGGRHCRKQCSLRPQRKAGAKARARPRARTRRRRPLACSHSQSSSTLSRGD